MHVAPTVDNVVRLDFEQLQRIYIESVIYMGTQHANRIADAFQQRDLWRVWIKAKLQLSDAKLQWYQQVLAELYDQVYVNWAVLVPLIYTVKDLVQYQDMAVEIAVYGVSSRQYVQVLKGKVQRHGSVTVRYELGTHERADIPNSAIIELYLILRTVSLPKNTHPLIVFTML